MGSDITSSMSSFVSSRLDFLKSNPNHPMTYAEVEHELQHVDRRKKISTAVSIVAGILSIITLVGLLGAGHVILGALIALAGVAAAYAYCCRLAEEGLRNRQITLTMSLPSNQVNGPAALPSNQVEDSA